MNKTINWMYFLYNFPHDFIKKCWESNPRLIEHMEAKLSAARHIEGKNYVSSGAMCRFFMDLDRDNQLILLNWVNINYKAF